MHIILVLLVAWIIGRAIVQYLREPAIQAREPALPEVETYTMTQEEEQSLIAWIRQGGLKAKQKPHYKLVHGVWIQQ